jgi:hypothetical protein
MEVGMPIILDFIRMCNHKQAEDMFNFLKNRCDVSKQHKFYREVLDGGIHIEQPPFWGNVSFDKMREIYKRFPYPKYNFTINGERIIRPLIMGTKHIMPLKQTPKTKYSCRNLGMISVVGRPSKALRYKRHVYHHSDTPIRVGEMETFALCMMCNSEEIAKFLSAYSNSPTNRAKLITDIMSTPAGVHKVHYEPVENTTINKETLETLLKVQGTKLSYIDSESGMIDDDDDEFAI